MLLKAIIIGFLIVLGEAINGNIRVRKFHRKFGKKRAKTISFFSGVLIIFTICCFTLFWIKPSDYKDCIFIGSIWLIIMICLDIYLARYVFKLKWNKILDDFNTMKGNLLGIRMIFLFFCPTVVFWLNK